MTVVAASSSPLVLLYQGWTYWVFRKRVAAPRVGSEDDTEAAGPPPATSPAES